VQSKKQSSKKIKSFASPSNIHIDFIFLPESSLKNLQKIHQVYQKPENKIYEIRLGTFIRANFRILYLNVFCITF
jgi:hypothetical protein